MNELSSLVEALTFVVWALVLLGNWGFDTLTDPKPRALDHEIPKSRRVRNFLNYDE
jgi:hypothetical protein